jgi:hypothetical protein
MSEMHRRQSLLVPHPNPHSTPTRRSLTHPAKNAAKLALSIFLIFSCESLTYVEYSGVHPVLTSPTETQTRSLSGSPSTEKQDGTQTRVLLGNTSVFRDKIETYANVSVSPFEKRWGPGWYLPRWATKKNLALSTKVPLDKRTCFVHVGKAGGSTLGCSLGFQLHCSHEEEQIISNGLLYNYTTNTFHNDVNDCPNDTAYFLFTIRHPLERARSGYNYDRPDPNHKRGRDEKSRLLSLDCPFPTFNDFAELGLSDTGTASNLCKRRAKLAILGKEAFGMHLNLNYGYYTNETLTDEGKKVLVIRTEHMDDDRNSAEVVLGGQPEAVTFPHRNQAKSSKAHQDSFLSKNSQRALCRALCNEIQIYKGLLHKALNLKVEQVKESLAELAASCPVETYTMSCPELL